MKKLFKHHFILVIGVPLLALGFFSFGYEIFAAPPTSSYEPGETLDPSCSPGDPNCDVRMFQWEENGDDLYYTLGNIGIGTSTPMASFDVAGDFILSGSDRYLNFGTATSSAGYGFRDNAGTIEYKDSGGSWAGFGGGGSSLWTESGSDIYFDSGYVSIGTSTSLADLTLISDGAGNSGATASVINTTEWWDPDTETLISGLNDDIEVFSVNANGGIKIGRNVPSSRFGGWFTTFSSWRDASQVDPDGGWQTEGGDNAMVVGANDSSGNRESYSYTYTSGSEMFTEMGSTDSTNNNAGEAMITVGHQLDGYAIIELTGEDGSTGDEHEVRVFAEGPNAGIDINAGAGTANELLKMRPVEADAADAIAYMFNTENTYTTAGALLMEVNNNDTQVFSIDKDGIINAANLAGGATNLSVDANGNIIRDPSDKTLKEDEGEFTNALSAIRDLEPLTYYWKDKDRFGSQEEIGFFAQDVQEVIPQAVRHGGDYLSLNHNTLTAVSIKAIQELDLRVDELAFDSGTDVDESSVIDRLLERMGAVIENGVTTFERLFVRELETERLCLEDTCITESELRELLRQEDQPIVEEEDDELNEELDEDPEVEEEIQDDEMEEESDNNTDEDTEDDSEDTPKDAEEETEEETQNAEQEETQNEDPEVDTDEETQQ